MKKILVVGSSNTDMVIKASELPRPGETVLGGEFFSFAGGKGANQAVAAVKLGGDVVFLAKVGDDELGKNSIQSFQKLGIDTSLIRSVKGFHSGVALILIDGNGENSISVASGANNSFTRADIDSIDEVLGQTEFVLAQLEIPIPMVEYLVEKCSEKGVKVILNPAPAAKLSPSGLAALNIITPNETEAEMLTGVKVSDEKSAEKAARVLLESGVENVIITLGAKGSYFLNRGEKGLIPAFPVQAIDTTAAGDTFNGALAVALAEGQSLKDSIFFANRAASISVTRMGAQDSQPFRHEIIL